MDGARIANPLAGSPEILTPSYLHRNNRAAYRRTNPPLKPTQASCLPRSVQASELIPQLQHPDHKRLPTTFEWNDVCWCTAAITCPRIHELAALLKEIGAPVGGLYCVGNRMGQCGFGNLAREIRLIGNPI